MMLTKPIPVKTMDDALSIHKLSFSGPELAPSMMFLNKFNKGNTFVEMDGDVMKGYAIVLTAPGPSLFLWEIAVADGFRRQGVAGRLIDEAVAWVEASDEYGLELTVRADNADAIRVYEAHGFKEHRRLKRFYMSGDGILMRREV